MENIEGWVNTGAESAVNLLAGENFRENSQAVMFGLPDAFEEMQGNPRFATPAAELQSFFSTPSEMLDMVDVMVSIAGALAVTELSNYTPKGFIIKIITGKGLKNVAMAAMAIGLIREYGDAAGPLFEQFIEIQERISNLDKLSVCKRAREIQAITDQLAQAMVEFVKNSGEGGMDSLKGMNRKLNLNKKDKEKDPYKDCKGTVTFGGDKLNIPRCSRAKGDWSNRSKPGDSIWKPTIGTPLFIELRKYGKTGIEYDKGYPVFEPFAYEEGVKAVINIGYFKNPENRNNDMDRAAEEYRQKLEAAGINNWESWPWPPTNSKGHAPAGWTWHHHEDGKTMVLVKSVIHNVGEGRARHCGGISCQANQ